MWASWKSHPHCTHLSLDNPYDQQLLKQCFSHAFLNVLGHLASLSQVHAPSAYQTRRLWSMLSNPWLQKFQWPLVAKICFFLSKILSTLMRWFIMWVNLFCTSKMVSPLSILYISHYWIKACFLALFTLVVPSWVTSRMSHISFTKAHCETMKNSSEFKAEVMMFLAIQSYWVLLVSLSVYWDQGFSMKTSSYSNFGTKGPFTIAS